MNRRWALMGVLWLPAVAPATEPDEPEIVTIRGQQHKVWPAEDLRARGFDVRDIPREKNAGWVYIEAINAYEELPASLADAFGYACGVAWPVGHAELANYLQQPGNRRAMELAHRAAAMARCRLPYFGEPRTSVLWILLPNLSGWRMVSKLLVAEGRRLESEGRYDEAVRNYLTTMRMGTHASRGATLIEGLVGLSIWHVADRAAAHMVLRRPLSARQLTTLHKQLSTYAPDLPTIERGLQGERALGPAVVDELCAQPFRLVANFRALSGALSDVGPETAGGLPSSDDGWGRLELRLGRLILPDRAVKRHMLGYYDKVIERARKGPAVAESDFDDERYVTEAIPSWDGLSRVMLPALSRATTHGERAKAELAALRTIVALRLHMLEHYGAPPAALDELDERLPGNAMIDPFSGRRLIYRRGAEGWTLYSVGPNLVDDGGRKGARWDELDMVYRLPPEPIQPFAPGEDDEP